MQTQSAVAATICRRFDKSSAPVGFNVLRLTEQRFKVAGGNSSRGETIRSDLIELGATISRQT